MNQQTDATDSPQRFDDDAWREKVRLAALARGDQEAQERLNSTPSQSADRGGGGVRARIPFRKPIRTLCNYHRKMMAHAVKAASG